MESSSENNKTGWVEYGLFFSTIGGLSGIPPGRDIMVSFLDPQMSALASLVLCVIGVGCIILHHFKK